MADGTAQGTSEWAKEGRQGFLVTWECSRVCFSHSTEHLKEEYTEVTDC